MTRSEAVATGLGKAAAQAIQRGEPPTPCPWDANGDSIVQARLAAAWSKGFLAEME